MRSRVALEAGLWYNRLINIVVSGSAANTPDRINLFRRFIMDTLPPHANNGNSSSTRPIPIYSGYFADTDGNIYSAWKTGKKPYINEDSLRMLHPALWRNGYLHLNIRLRSYVYASIGVHRLVCLAFYGIPPEGYTASHLNGNRQDNRVSNLMWESMSDNHQRKKEHGTDDRGCHNSRAKINEETLVQIRAHLQEGVLTQKQIGDLFGLSRLFITKIKNGHRYKEA